MSSGDNWLLPLLRQSCILYTVSGHRHACLTTIKHHTRQSQGNCSITQLINYAAAHPDATIQHITSDMYLHIHSDASYLSDAKIQSCVGGTFSLSNHPNDTPATPSPSDIPTPHKGAAHMIISIMQKVMASATYAELAALFHNTHSDIPLCTSPLKMGRPQGQTPIQTVNACASGSPMRQ
jgi:hypothetical protein